jgi:hypothetical protein
MSKRELIDTGTDKRYVRRDKDGKFKRAPTSRDRSPPMPATTRSMMRSLVRATRAIASTDGNAGETRHL